MISDAFLGILLVDFEQGKAKVILSGQTVVDGKRIGFADDFDVSNGETVIFRLSFLRGYIFLAFEVKDTK